MADYKWPELGKRKVIGQRLSRLDGVQKASGKAKYNSDIRPNGMLHAVLLTSPHAHAKIKSIDISEAKASKGVKAVRVIAQPGQELQWAGAEIAAVAATTEELARDAVRKIKIDYEVLPHVVREEDLSKVGNRAKPSGERIEGDPDEAWQKAEVKVEGKYSAPVITHCCLEPHGQVSAWRGDKIDYWPSTQNVSGVGPDLARSLNVPAANITVAMDHIGGGFGAKFPSDLWGAEGTQLSKEAGGMPVKLFLDRAQELTIGGVRPSFFANIKIGGTKDGKITAWQSESWATGGFGGGGAGPLPYVFRIPNMRAQHSAVSLNAGSARAWRAPNHPQVSFLTCSAIEDFAAKIGMDPLEVYKKNADLTSRPETYIYQLDKAAELIEWKKNWKAPGTNGSGHLKRGLGIGVATWGGAGHDSTAKVTIHPDGSVEVEMGSQDLGTGTRTIVAMVAAETFGLQPSQVTVKIGRNAYPASGASGGSTTVGGVSTSARKATTKALNVLMEKIAPMLGAPPDQLEAVDQRIQVKGNPAKGMTWKQAANKLGTISITETDKSEQRRPDGMFSAGTGGVQMADVTVDTETGVVRMNKMVAVQDCGLVVNPKLAESQVYGAMIMNICSALYEERVMDQQTGRVLNPDMEFYKLAGTGDIGELVVHMDIREENDKRGIIGLGEPPAIPGAAAVANAVANALGVRVGQLPLNPRNVLNALAQRNGRMA